RPHGSERLFDLGLGALADGHHGDDRADADDDAERGEKRAHLVAQEGAHRHAQRLQQAHDCTLRVAASMASSSSGEGSARAAAAASLGAWRSSERTRPSRITITRAAYSAMSGSCVTSTTVMPCLPSVWNSAITSTLVLESRLPVGSSARMSLGRATSA